MTSSDLHTRLSACHQSVLLFYRGIDRGDFALAMQQVAPECHWERGGASLRTREDVEASLRKRSATQVMRHIVSNFVVLAHDAQHVTAAYALGLHLYDNGAPPTLPVPGSTPFMLVDVTCQLALQPDQAWRIRQLDVERTFSYSREVISPLAAPASK